MRWIGHQLRTGRVLYIHCAAGVGRSATLLACWYIHAQGLSVSQALYRLKTRRPQVFLTRRQRQRLHAYAARRQRRPGRHDTGTSAAADLAGDASVSALKSESQP
jgi:atypical dual specificity phosphatase